MVGKHTSSAMFFLSTALWWNRTSSVTCLCSHVCRVPANLLRIFDSWSESFLGLSATQAILLKMADPISEDALVGRQMLAQGIPGSRN